MIFGSFELYFIVSIVFCNIFALLGIYRDMDRYYILSNQDYRNYKLYVWGLILWWLLLSKLKLITIMKQFKNQSLPFIRLDPDTNQLRLTPESKKFLSSLTKPISITSIAGLYRTGKSYLVNKLIPSSNTGQQQHTFRVGTTTQSMTKGLNILSNPIIMPCNNNSPHLSASQAQDISSQNTMIMHEGEQIYYLLVDSQGLGSCQRSTKYDMDLLILMFLISSTVVYNSMGAIDEQSLQQLQVVLKLKKCIDMTQHKYESCTYRYASDPPKFIWVLRDFSLQLIDKNGNEITPDQYLQQCLEQSPSQSQQTRKKNQIRKAIKQNLGQRHCYTLVRPTIKEQDLQSLASYRVQSNVNMKGKSENQGKIRAQFVGQIEEIKGKLFGGNLSDVKKINGHCVTGRVFVKILEEYLQVINKNELPNVTDIWSSVIKISNQQTFQQLLHQLKKQSKQLHLPLPPQQLKLKLNQLQNRLYQALQKQLTPTSPSPSSCSQYKEYQKQFLKQVQKINKELKQKNEELRKNYVLSDLHTFVRDNLRYEDIRIQGLADGIKQFLDRCRIRVQGVSDGYEYVLGVIVDIIFVVQQKYSKNTRQQSQLKTVLQTVQLDLSTLQLSHKSLKREYHESLKTIARLQQHQQSTTKQQNKYQSKLLTYQTSIHKLQLQLSETKYNNQKYIKDLQEKYKCKVDQFLSQIKKLKEERKGLEDEVDELRGKVIERECQGRKEEIFQERMRESFDQFHQERLSLKKQLENYKKQTNSINEKYIELKTQYQKQEQKQKELQEQHTRKQQNLMKQFENLKQTLKQTKASYERTYETYQTTQNKINKLTGYSTSKKDREREKTIDKVAEKVLQKDKAAERYQTPGKEVLEQWDGNRQRTDMLDEKVMESNRMLKKYYQTQIEKIQQDHRLQMRRLEDQIIGLQKQVQRKQTDKQIYFMQAKQYKQKCLKLESDIVAANAKFNQFLKDIEQAKQKQRTLYEQSIVRLLNNIERRDRQSKDNSDKNRDSFASSAIEERFSINIPNIHLNGTEYRQGNRRKDRPSENVKDSLSFGHVFRTK